VFSVSFIFRLMFCRSALKTDLICVCSGADAGFLIIGGADLENLFSGKKKKVKKNVSFPLSTPSLYPPNVDFRGGAKWIFRIFKGEKQKMVVKSSKKHNPG